MTGARRGVILPVVLLVLLLVGVLGAMFSFRVNADLSSTQAIAYRLQTRLAAEAGIERIGLLLRDARFDQDMWYHNPEELHRIIVWGADLDPTVIGTNEEFEEDWMVYRFSIVADDPTDDEDYIRFGITDEASKLNLNVATEEQLLVLVRAAVGDDEEIIPQDIVDAILDWRDEDDIPRGEDGDTEGEYYRSLDKPYRVKNGPFNTVEELLLVKGVTDNILYGEDFDRNGLLTPNEEDGERSFPPDNEDDLLNRGLYPYLTVLSTENNVSNTNRPRTYLFADEETLRAELALVFEDEPGLIDFIVTATRSGPGGGEEADTKQAEEKKDGPGGDADSTGNGGDEILGGDESLSDGDSSIESGEEDENEGLEAVDDPEGGAEESADEGEGEGETKPEVGEQTSGAGSGRQPIRSPASLLLDQTVDGELRVSPLGPEHLPDLMDRFTAEPPERQTIPGLININTAPPRVLRCLSSLSSEEIEEIVEVRQALSAEAKATTAWLVVEEVLDAQSYAEIAPFITARGQQFMIESLGYADHIGMVTRLQVVVDMVGPIAQTIYYRDLTQIGGHFPIREEDLEQIRVR